MKMPGHLPGRHLGRFLFSFAVFLTLAGCLSNTTTEDTGPFAPGVDVNADAENGVEVGHRLMTAGFARTALETGLTSEIMLGMGTANLGLGRLGQAEDTLRELVEQEPDWPEAWNNLGVVLMERGKTVEAEQIFRKAFALDNGKSDSIRDNLRIALAKSENPATTEIRQQEYKLVRRGSSDFLISQTP